jgi:hypothetical protein
MIFFKRKEREKRKNKTKQKLPFFLNNEKNEKLIQMDN